MVLHQISLARSIYPANEDETPPQIFMAFVEGTYHNIPDFWELWMQLRHSLTRAMLSRERDLVCRANKEVIDPVAEITGTSARKVGLIVDQLWDQRDLTVMTNCELPGNPSPEDFTRPGPLQRVHFSLVLYLHRRIPQQRSFPMN